MIKVEAVRDVHGWDWIKLRKFFDPTHYGGSKKKFNPTYIGWVGQVEPMS